MAVSAFSKSKNDLEIGSDGMSHTEKFNQLAASKKKIDIKQRHVWGCPVFVLDHRLQNVQKIPKWDERVRVGAYMGRSPNHAGNVALVLNLSTGHVSPQYHIVFDDKFKTVEALQKGVVPSRWEYIAKIGYESATDEDINLTKLWKTRETVK